MKRKLLACLVAAATVVSGLGSILTVSAASTDTLTPKTIAKSDSGNPMLGFGENGELVYGGDPSILVDGDTVYCYVGEDTSTNDGYYMKRWLCYSSQDMVNWKYESVIMNNSDVSWAANDHEAWAAQVMKYKDKYYFYYTTEGSNAKTGGGKCIGVAVSDSATGPFVDIGEPLVRNVDTPNGQHTWEDIDPTAWIETDENGVDHRVLGWGNSRFFNCELNEDMISITDQDGDGEITLGTDIKVGKINGVASYYETNFNTEANPHFFTEAPYYYRQQDEDGNYYGKYYLFFACDWREQMAYATADTYEDFVNNDWDFGGILMEPSATANTNHMAVFDFQGQTYFVYHDGSLPWGSGYRRVACVEEMEINEDGSIDPIEKTAVGLTGTVSTITNYYGEYLAHQSFENTTSDSDYPIINKSMSCSRKAKVGDSQWEINPGKADTDNEYYVSIESNNKPGLYIAANDAGTSVVLSQDYAQNDTDAAKRMTFKTYEGMAGRGVTFESVRFPGKYLVSDKSGSLSLSDDPDPQEATFFSTGTQDIQVLKTKRLYGVGDTLATNDITVRALYGTGSAEILDLDDCITNAADIDMSTEGDKILTVTYTGEDGISYTGTTTITVVSADYFTPYPHPLAE